MSGFIIFAILGAAAVIALLIWGWMHERKRRDALMALADARGWRYLAKDSHDIPGRFRSFEPFNTGHSRYAQHVMTGREEDIPFELFEYHYAVTTSNGKTTTTHHYHHRVAALPMPIAAPDLLIRDEHLGHKLMQMVGGEDIDFESHEFSRRFWVRCRDRRFAYDVIHTGMMEFLLPLRGWTWQWQGPTLLIFASGRLKPEDVPTLLELVTRFRRLLPRHLLAAAPVVNR